MWTQELNNENTSLIHIVKDLHKSLMYIELCYNISSKLSISSSSSSSLWKYKFIQRWNYMPSHIETSSIDGETNLKLRVTPSYNEDGSGNKLETLEEAIKRITPITCLGYPDGISAIDNPIINDNNNETRPSNDTDSQSNPSITPSDARNTFKHLSYRRKEELAKPSSEPSKITNYFKSFRNIIHHVDDDDKEKNYIAIITSEPPKSSVNTYSGFLTIPPT